MNLYLVPNDLSKAAFVSTNGVAQYKVTTRRKHVFGAPRSRIHRPAFAQRSEADRLVAEIDWNRWSHPVVKSNAFDGTMQEIEVKEFLYKLGRKFSTTRYFLGNDDKEYCWKDVKGIGHVLSNRDTKAEVARFTFEIPREGTFEGDKKWFLQIKPSTLDVDMIIITFIIMEKRRREREADKEKDTLDGENPFESGFDGGIAAA